MDYEKNIQKLNEIIEKLSNDKLSLEESVKLYEQAEVLYKQCSDYLSLQTGKVYKIKQDLEHFTEEKMDWLKLCLIIL